MIPLSITHCNHTFFYQMKFQLSISIPSVLFKFCYFYISEFIQGVSQFSVKGDKLSKLRFAFRIYDMDNDGYISNGELFQVSLYIFILSST